ncbi:uncharacterized protein LOC135398604 [Ornithodoros turicata]|uniref:uncharacterized protein LOC135398604 n=1 Tax=Ornithodoros turicata TaxID=34597 RepID=UPI003138DF6D
MSSGSHYTRREIRQLAFISEFTTDIRHVSGCDNTVAVALSRIGNLSPSTPPSAGLHFSLDTLVEFQRADAELARLRLDVGSALRLEDALLPGAAKTLVCDVSHRQPRPYSSLLLCAAKFLTRCMSLLAPTSAQPKNALRLASYESSIQALDPLLSALPAGKIHRHTHTPISTFLPPDVQFDKIHLDLVGPLPPSQGHRILLTVVDRYTRWPRPP